jgi:hypothetical protein
MSDPKSNRGDEEKRKEGRGSPTALGRGEQERSLPARSRHHPDEEMWEEDDDQVPYRDTA